MEHLYRPIQSSTGDLMVNSSVRVMNPATSTPIGEALYADAEGTTTLENPFVAINGVIDFYLSKPKRVRLGITPPSMEEFYFENIDVGDAEVYRETVPFAIAGAQVVKQYLARYYISDACRIIEVRVSAGVAPTGSDLIVDVNKNGTSMFSSGARPRITAGSNAGVVYPDGLTLDPGDYITLDVDQIGSATPGSEVVVQVRTERI